MMITIKPSMFNPSLDKNPMTVHQEAAHFYLFDQSREAKAVRTVSIIAASAFVGGPIVARFASATRPARNVLTWINHPIAKTLATQQSYRSVALGANAYLKGAKAIRYASYAAAAYSPFETYRYLNEGDYTRAGLQWYGPPGTVYVYNQLSMKPVNADMGIMKTTSTKQPKVVKSSKTSTKKSKMTAKQRRRLNRMGLRYCHIHRRYDRCHSKK